MNTTPLSYLYNMATLVLTNVDASCSWIFTICTVINEDVGVNGTEWKVCVEGGERVYICGG